MIADALYLNRTLVVLHFGEVAESGLSRSPAKGVVSKEARGFESPSLRFLFQKLFDTLSTLGYKKLTLTSE